MILEGITNFVKSHFVKNHKDNLKVFKSKFFGPLVKNHFIKWSKNN
jgi:hypothetical protein